MKKTKIICSIGPASCNYETMKEMILAGMNVARINFSHGSLEEREKTVELVNTINKELNTHVAVLFDTKGPDFRTLEMENGKIELVEGATIRIVKEDVIGTKEAFSVNYKYILDSLKVGDYLLIDDGYLKLEVISVESSGVTTRIIYGGMLKSRKSINIPDCNVEIPFLSDDDIEDIKYACIKNGDYLALSFVSCKEDIIAIRKLIHEYGNPSMQIISKVETKKGLQNIDDIIEYSDGIMVARGDLGVEMSLEKIPMIQKDIITKCRKNETFCIVATEMLASMEDSPRPTRAEVNDVATAVLDGADAVMLSAESSVGKYPGEAVTFMSNICQDTEDSMEYQITSIDDTTDVTKAIAHSVIDMVEAVKAKLIVCATLTGYTARKVSNLRPRPLVLATCPNEKIARSLALNWGVYPVITEIQDNTDDVIEDAKHKAKEFMFLNPRDLIVITGGFVNDLDVKNTNIIKVEEI